MIVQNAWHFSSYLKPPATQSNNLFHSNHEWSNIILSIYTGLSGITMKLVIKGNFMLAIVRARAIVGLDGRIIEVQVDFNPRAALPSFTIVGLPDSAVRESRERVRSAVKNSGLQFPNKAYVVNLSPADLPKHGPAYDLAIAIGVLAATDLVPLRGIEDAVFIGELLELPQ
jgi:hypothetical protein